MTSPNTAPRLRPAKGVLEGRSPSHVKFPLPLIKGKGIKGIGLPSKNLKQVRLP